MFHLSPSYFPQSTAPIPASVFALPPECPAA